MRRRRRRKKENAEGKGPKSFQSLIGFDRPSYKYASQISERRSDGEEASRRHLNNRGNGSKSDIRRENVFRKVVSASRDIDDLVSRNFERDHEGGDYDSQIYDSGGDPVSREHDRDYESRVTDYYRGLEGDASAAEERLTDGFEVEFGDWLSKFGVDRTTQSPPRRRRLTSEDQESELFASQIFLLIYIYYI